MNKTDNTRAFADACYDFNTIDELQEALIPCARSDYNRKNDCAQWELTPAQWRSAIQAALTEKLADA